MAEAIVADSAASAPVLNQPEVGEAPVTRPEASELLHWGRIHWQGSKPVSHLISFVRIPALAIRQHILPLPPLAVLGEDTLRLTVWPNDIDLNLHMNNARYLSWMDYGRTHLLARTRVLEHIIRSRWQPLVGAVWITYRRSLPVFSSFRLSTRLVCWDERWFYLEQTFTGSKGLAAVGWVKGALRNANGSVDPQKVIEGVVPGLVSPPMPDAIAAWNELTREKLAGNA